ncbi:vacuolar protein sorting-associated protein 35 [Plasmodium gonderi]|uniref:Vacuolar protein sorting-associated protein 35 n=1 Tax=Plasmodium gonderi TaxID=77519 RepID=A0A1Y1JEF5_PLAGO|nr:vacuolar protein sorting-associated protein 35 [Plasmodium gonderi]GAW80876.1 vacuolar protein sorting-associated protein 35 [Plasmodium gonderi]
MNNYKDLTNTAVDQKKFLDECIFIVKEQSFYMKQALENGSLRDTLKHASNMLCELRTSQLSPKYYYELYMLIFNELQHLDTFINDKKKHKKKFIDIYESVQHAGNIIPRLYLLIIVGRNYIKNKDIKAKYILKDMTELCKGIQHPLRGLFLRYFLIQMCKDRIPDTGSEYEEAGGGNIDDAFEFLLANFYESIKLWSRMSDKVIVKLPTSQDEQIINNNRTKILKEKMDVKMLVGSILVRMSQLEGMTRQYYIEKCLPKLLQNLSTINDSLIQQYIFESMVQVFSDECHIYTLDILLNAVLKINSSLDFKSILITLLKRLRSFIESNKYELPKEVDIFNLFYEHLVLYINRTLDAYREEKKGSYNWDHKDGSVFPSKDSNSELYNGKEKKCDVTRGSVASTIGTSTAISVATGTTPININDLGSNCKIVKTSDSKNYPHAHDDEPLGREKKNRNPSTTHPDTIYQSGDNYKTLKYDGNLNKTTHYRYSNDEKSKRKKGDDIFVENIVKMLQVIYEFIFLCIRIYDDVITISKLFHLPYTIVSNVDLNNDIICEQVISIIVLPFNFLGLSALKGKNMLMLLESINSDKYKKKLSLDIIDAIIECKNKPILYQDVEQIMNYISPIFNESAKRKNNPSGDKGLKGGNGANRTNIDNIDCIDNIDSIDNIDCIDNVDNNSGAGIHERGLHHYHQWKEADVFNLENSTVTYAAKKMCKFFHIITNTDDIESKYNICILFHKHIENGPYLVHLLPTIIFTMLSIVTTIINLIPNLESNPHHGGDMHGKPFEKKEHIDEEEMGEEDDNIILQNNNNNNKDLGRNNNIMNSFVENYSDGHDFEKKVIQYNIHVKNILKFIHTNLLAVANQIPILAFKLFLHSAVIINNYNRFIETYPFLSFDNLEAICYEFITQPLIIYEEDINMSSQQYNCIVWIVGILCSHITLLENENYENIALKLTQHANKLLKKKDQCLGILTCSHLYWENNKYRNSAKTFECLQKCIKNAEIAVQSNSDNIVLFLYMLQKYIYYYEAENIEITEDNINYLLQICHDHYSKEKCDSKFKNEYVQTVKYIHDKKISSNAFAKIAIDISVLP